MDLKVCLALLLLGAMCCTARELAAPDLLIIETESGSALSVNNLQTERQLQPLKDASRNKGLCTLCEEYTTSALGYLANNETQSKILDILHQTCSRMPIYKQECTAMVDQYVPAFFLEISTLKAEEICLKVDLCQEMEKMVSISQQFSQNGCSLCHQVVKEALLKLKDPDAQLDILELLLKACGAVENYANKCKKLVFEYAPVILINAENFLEKNDVCSIVHACEPAAGKERALPKMQTSLHSAS